MAPQSDLAVQTFVFADLSGFTTLTEAHEDEQAADLVDRAVPGAGRHAYRSGRGARRSLVRGHGEPGGAGARPLTVPNAAIRLRSPVRGGLLGANDQQWVELVGSSRESTQSLTVAKQDDQCNALTCAFEPEVGFEPTTSD
jgi:hypothetical protein